MFRVCSWFVGIGFGEIHNVWFRGKKEHRLLVYAGLGVVFWRFRAFLFES